MADEQQQPTNASTPSTTTLTNAASNLPAQPTSEPKKAIKIEQADVNFLVSELDVSKARAGDMLRASGGDRKAAVSAFVVG